MHICVLSVDAEINRLCGELAESHRDRGFKLIHSGLHEEPPQADVYVLEFRAGSLLPPGFTGELLHKSVLVVDRCALAELRGSLERVPLAVLLKPLNRAHLEIALERMITRGEHGDCELLRLDRDNLLQQVLLANLSLQEYDQDRTNFIGRALHEFRAPLTSLNGYCGLLLSGNLGILSGAQREAVERMRHSVARLSRLSTMMFQLSVAKEVKPEPRLEAGDIIACIEQTLQAMAPIYQARRIQLEWHCKAPTEELHFAPDQIEQVMVNLLENSCKFTPKGGCIEVKAHPYFWERRVAHAIAPGGTERRRRESRTFNAFKVEITDDGPGIPPEHAATIFEEYTSYCGGEDRSGAGLGLAICKVILRSHGGRIWAEASASGARFCFVLPYGPPVRDVSLITHRNGKTDSRTVFAF